MFVFIVSFITRRKRVRSIPQSAQSAGQDASGQDDGCSREVTQFFLSAKVSSILYIVVVSATLVLTGRFSFVVASGLVTIKIGFLTFYIFTCIVIFYHLRYVKKSSQKLVLIYVA